LPAAGLPLERLVAGEAGRRAVKRGFGFSRREGEVRHVFTMRDMRDSFLVLLRMDENENQRFGEVRWRR
jgi:hypothetical protein